MTETELYTFYTNQITDEFEDYSDLSRYSLEAELVIRDYGDISVEVSRDGQAMLTFDDIGVFCSWADDTGNLEELAASTFIGHPTQVEAN